jgi:hypothetical protein
MTGKHLLLRDKQLAAWWADISHDPRFDQVMSLASFQIAASNPTQETMQGVNSIIQLLPTFSDNEDGSSQLIPSPGLIHHMPGKPKE